jgi:hypothetical protein
VDGQFIHSSAAACFLFAAFHGQFDYRNCLLILIISSIFDASEWIFFLNKILSHRWLPNFSWANRCMKLFHKNLYEFKDQNDHGMSESDHSNQSVNDETHCYLKSVSHYSSALGASFKCKVHLHNKKMIFKNNFWTIFKMKLCNFVTIEKW